MYFIEKTAVYSHGVFWFGEDLKEAKKECDKLASEDVDAHHDYKVYKFGILNTDKMKDKEGTGYYWDVEHDPEHKEMYRVNKNDVKAN